MSQRRILLVDDDDSLRLIASLSLQSIGKFKVLAVRSGAEALAQAEAFAPDLFVLDVNMPDLDGPQTLAGLREMPSLREVPAVFLTGNVKPEEVAALQELGAADVIAKPFEPRRMCERVAQALERNGSQPRPG
jgi:two-component system OmpR family response regulator